MILVKKLVNWCYKETKPEIIERERVYISCKDFFLHSKAEKQLDYAQLIKKRENVKL